MLALALSTFFIKLSLGVLPGLTLVQKKDTGTGFFRLLIFLSFIFGLLGIGLNIWSGHWSLGIDSFSSVASVFNFFLGSFLLGSALLSMIMGHWYLIRPRLSFHYLIRAVWILLILAMLRLAFVLVSILLASPGFFRDVIYQMDILVWMRFLWGGVLPLFFLILALQCAKIHSNRSCTGILYFTTASIFMGELMAGYLSLVYKMPL